MTKKEIKKLITEERKIFEVRTISLLIFFYMLYGMLARAVTLQRGYYAIGGEGFLFIGLTIFAIAFPYSLYKKAFKRYTDLLGYLLDLESDNKTIAIVANCETCQGYEMFYLDGDKLKIKKMRTNPKLLDEEKLLSLIK